MSKEYLERLSKEELIELVISNSKNTLALDGYWFQAAEKKLGMDVAMELDTMAWAGFTVTEARRVKKFLKLEEHGGLKALAMALDYRFNRNCHEAVIECPDEKTLIYRVTHCVVQDAREAKGMPYHPCKPVGLVEYSDFAKTIDDRISCECISCFPDVTEPSCSCVWKFTLNE